VGEESKVTAHRKCLLWSWIVLVAGASLYPPWIETSSGINQSVWDEITGHTPGHSSTVVSGHYEFLLATYTEGRIDVGRLLLEWAVITLVSAGFCFAPVPLAWLCHLRLHCPSPRWGVIMACALLLAVAGTTWYLVERSYSFEQFQKDQADQALPPPAPPK